MLVRDRHDPVALLTVPVLAFVEEDTEGALRVLVLQLVRGEGNA